MSTLHKGSAVVVVRDAMTGDRDFTNEGQKLVRFGDGSEKAVNAEDLYEGDPDEHRRKSGGLGAVGVRQGREQFVDWGKKRSVRPGNKVSRKAGAKGKAGRDPAVLGERATAPKISGKKAKAAGPRKSSGKAKARAPKPAKTVNHGRTT
jgi:hypothetical protein